MAMLSGPDSTARGRGVPESRPPASKMQSHSGLTLQLTLSTDVAGT